MSRYFDTKGKSVTPEETISRIQGILSELGIVTVQQWNEVDGNLFSLNLRIAGTCIFSNGKGLSEQYALASAYAELMERLQSMVLFRYSIPMVDPCALEGGFTYSPDEKWRPIDDIECDEPFIADLFGGIVPDVSEKNDMLRKIEGIFSKEDPEAAIHEGKLSCVPFEGFATGEITDIPLRALDIMCGSNGLCAGNTRDEALVQGFSELFERYVNRKIIEEKITPPDIPRDYIGKNYPKLDSIIKTIEEHGVVITLKDCSLGKKYPVVAAICRDIGSAKYFVKFGASPDLGIAAERCLTEMFQGRSLKTKHWLKKRFYVEDAKFIRRNIETNLHDGDGYYPLSLFGESDTAFSGWYYKGTSNEEYLAEIKEVLRENGFSAYVHNWTAVSFPTYQIYIPGMSFIYADADERISWHVKLSKVRSMLLNISGIGLEQTEFLRDFIAENSAGKGSIAPFLPVPMYASSRYSKMPADLFISALYIRNGMFPEAFSALYPLYSSSDDVMINMLSIWLILKSSGKEDAYIRGYMQKNFSDAQNEAFGKFLNDGDILAGYELKCFDCSGCSETSCCYKSVYGIYNKVRSYISSKR